MQPPTNLLAWVVAVRVHLDDYTTTNGPVRVLPGSHCAGTPQWRRHRRVARVRCSKHHRLRWSRNTGASSISSLRPTSFQATSRGMTGSVTCGSACGSDVLESARPCQRGAGKVLLGDPLTR